MAPNSWMEDAWTKTQFMALRKRDREWRIALSNHYAWLQTRGWRMHEWKRNSCGSERRGRERRIALSNHYGWLQTRGWRMHERKRNSWGSEKGVENGELHWAITTHSSKLEGGGHMNENAIHGAQKRLRMQNWTKQSLRMAPNSKVEDTWTKTQFMGVWKWVENGDMH